jgi:hypothetical protein
MANANVTRESFHVMLAKNITHQTIAFALIKAAIAKGHHARRILASMLQYGECIVNRLIDRACSNYANYATHRLAL